jgi:hypothetical protein
MAVLSITPLISADTGDGAAGCASGSHTCSGSTPALAPKPNRASRKPIEAQNGDSLRAHVGEGVVAGVGLQHAEAQQDGDGADARHRDVQVAGAAHLGMRWLAVTRKNDDSAIVSHITMKA